MAVSLRQILVFVGDAPACAAWYCKHLGLTSLESSPTWCVVDAGGVKIGFHQAYGADGPSKEATGSEANPHKLVFEVDDLVKTRDELQAAGVEVLDLSASAPRRFDAIDLEGHRFQLVERGSS